MGERPKTDYSPFDRPEILLYLFHPRPETGYGGGSGYEELSIPVAGGETIGGRLYTAGPMSPTLLFFHGNGEIVSDYNDMGPVYNRMGINFFPVDYRGYGRSSGSPTVTAMMADCQAIFDFARHLLTDRGYSGPFILMGRSLGSASVLELASTHPEANDGLIVESGFAYAAPLLRLLGIDPERIGFREEQGFRNVDKIALFRGDRKSTRLNSSHRT